MNRIHQQTNIRRAGFSLVEIVIALGIMAFCVVPLVGVLAVAFQQSREAQEKTEIAFVLQSMQASLRGAVSQGINSLDLLKARLSTAPQTNFFADGGRFLGTNATVSGVTNFYRCVVSTNAFPSSPTRLSVTVEVQYPAPAYTKRVSLPVSLFRYGTRW